MHTRPGTDQHITDTRAMFSHTCLLIALLCAGLGLWIGLQRETDAMAPDTRTFVTQADTRTFVTQAEVFIHPLCLDRSSGLRINAGFWCEEAFADIGIERSGNGDAAYYSADRPPDGDSHRLGYVGYRVAWRRFDEETAVKNVLLEVSDSGGGTGIFSRLLLMEKREDSMYRELLRIHGGDRCNDGVMRLISITPEEVIYSTAATPFRLLNPVDGSDWRMLSLYEMLADGSRPIKRPATLSGWQPYKQIAHCAICCEGDLIRRYDIAQETNEVVAVSFAENAFANATRDDAINECLNRWSDGHATIDLANIAIEDWLAELARLEEVCGDRGGR